MRRPSPDPSHFAPFLAAPTPAGAVPHPGRRLRRMMHTPRRRSTSVQTRSRRCHRTQNRSCRDAGPPPERSQSASCMAAFPGNLQDEIATLDFPFEAITAEIWNSKWVANWT